MRTSTLGDVGSIDAPPGSRDWAVAVRLDIQATLNDVRGEAEHLDAMLGLLRQHEGWRKLTNGKRQLFASYEAFCLEPQPYGLGYRTEDIDRIIGERRRANAQTLAANPAVGPAAAHGGARAKGEQGDNVPLPRGNSASGIVRRLKRDHPEIAAALANGEYRSARAAGIAAGFVKVQTPLEKARAAVARLSAEERATLVAELTRSAV